MCVDFPPLGTWPYNDVCWFSSGNVYCQNTFLWWHDMCGVTSANTFLWWYAVCWLVSYSMICAYFPLVSKWSTLVEVHCVDFLGLFDKKAWLRCNLVMTVEKHMMVWQAAWERVAASVVSPMKWWAQWLATQAQSQEVQHLVNTR